MYSSTFVIFVLFLTLQYGNALQSRQQGRFNSQAIGRAWYNLMQQQDQMIAQLPGGKIVPVDFHRLLEMFQNGKITMLLNKLKQQPKYYTDDGESASEFYFKH